MAKQNQQKQTERRVMTSRERLGLRVSEMINSPSAQLNRRVTIHRLDTDEDQAWEEVLELLGETDGLEMTFNDDGTVTLQWAQQEEEGEPLPSDGWADDEVKVLWRDSTEKPAPF
ncbi:hypothetical protein DMX10_13920 [Pseudomonas sp. 57B-090624]|uniref:DUF1654 domain-containing protein n=1 Tax=Pseudomonas sp. 57B-090624 TaxID=2213080 RepID=UPI000DAA0B29|nr:DUF1654 domain-containing protein [Pseudomonas sp. 57B-090624]PZE12725.1 hypothetical protein DMX10_13920 [Pseudomonas sp. 57B-090624]